MVLTEEQRRRMEENRRKALEKRKSEITAKNSTESLFKKPKTNSFYGCASNDKFKSTADTSSFSSSRSDLAFPKSTGKPSSSSPSSSSFPSSGSGGNKITGNCILISKTRFSVEVKYHEQLISTFKTLKSAQYDFKSRLWSFSLADHDSLIQKTRSFQPDVVVLPLPNWIIRTFVKKTRDKDEVEEDPNKIFESIDPHLRDCLMPFQKEGVRYSVARNGRVLIADDMGLGKTIQALGVASYYSGEWPLFIVAPSSVRFSWKASILKWLPSISEDDITVITSGKDYLCNGKVIIISYDLLAKKWEELVKKDFKIAILDESHFLKNHKSIRCQAAEKILKGTQRIILLSGTPALSRPMELYTQISIIEPKLFPYPTDFGMRYCDGKKISFGGKGSHFDFSGSSNMTELRLVLEEKCMIRRLKSDVLSQLPSKQRQMIILDPLLVKAKSKEMKEQAKLVKSLRGSERRGMLLEWFNSTATAKEKAVLEYISDLLEGDKKFICFAHHQVMIVSIAELLKKKKVGYIRIDGKTASDSRKVLVDKFQTDDGCRVALLSITAANAGISLTAAQLVVFAELFWNPGILTQAEDRAHRIGQTDSVIIQYLVAKGTADDELWPLIQKKLDVLNKAGLTKDNFQEADVSNAVTTSSSARNERRITDFFSTSFTEDDLSKLELENDNFFDDIDDEEIENIVNNINIS